MSRLVVLVVHWTIIVLLAIEALYCWFQVLFVVRPAGAAIAPLFGAAGGMDPDMLLARRAYAIEGWVGFGALAVYLAITEIGPRLRAVREADGG